MVCNLQKAVNREVDVCGRNHNRESKVVSARPKPKRNTYQFTEQPTSVAIQFVGSGGRATGLQGLGHTTPLRYFSTIASPAQRPSSGECTVDISFPGVGCVLAESNNCASCG
jgi:hypothetical protein